MKALLSDAPGGPETLRLGNLPNVIPGPHDVLIQVYACGMNYPDTLIIEDKYQFKPPRPFAPGGEVSGIVAAVGNAVTTVAVGDRVIGSTLWGGLAEQLMVPEHRCVRIPDSMPFDDAAAFLLTFGTSYYALKERGQIQAGETVAILGAAGGIGLASLKLAKAIGARVVAAVSTPEKAEIAKSNGADAVVIYAADMEAAAGKQYFTADLKQACGPAGADIVVDAVGGPYSEAALRAIAWNGRFLVLGFPAGIAAIPLNLALLKSCQIIGVFWGAWVDRCPEDFRRSTQELFALYETKGVAPAISARFPLPEAAKAFQLLSERKAVGKIVVTLDDQGAAP